MHLLPKNPPRTKSRRVRAFAAEIRRLQAEGYTFDEIRQALADVGVVVSTSTVQREAARVPPQMTQPVAVTTAAAAQKPAAGRAIEREPVPPSHLPRVDDPRSARKFAEEFMKTQITNPLLYGERETP